MKLVDRLIWREMFGPLLNSVFMFIILIFSSAYLPKLTDLMGKGASFELVAKVALYSMPLIITQTLPMGMLLGTLLAFGRLSGDSENIAMYACGISFYRVARPVALMGLLVGGIAIAWDQTVVPPATREFYRLSQDVIDQTTADRKPLNYVVKRPGGDSVDEFVSIDGGYDAKTRSLYRVTIVKMSLEGQPEFTVYADRAQFRDPQAQDAQFYNGRVIDMRPNSGSKYVIDSKFNEATTGTLPKDVRLGRNFKGIMQADVNDNRRMTFLQLRDKIKEKRAKNDDTADADEFDLWSKIAIPLASLIFALVAAPLGIRPHRGSKAMGFGIAVSLIFCYWVLNQGMYSIAKNGGISPFIAAFTADIVGLLGGILLAYRTRQ